MKIARRCGITRMRKLRTHFAHTKDRFDTLICVVNTIVNRNKYLFPTSSFWYAVTAMNCVSGKE